MSWIFTFILVLVLSYVNSNEECPAEYRRFAVKHTYCLPPNTTCNFLDKHMPDEDEIAEILDAHNFFRSVVAMGEEEEAGGLPTASNMLEMTWDPELAEIAQKFSEQCVYDHDCNECRDVDGYDRAVGQNLAESLYICRTKVCKVVETMWGTMVEQFYREIEFFDKSIVKSYDEEAGTGTIGHLTQVIWANSFKVGCGYAQHQEGNISKQLYACNYGPNSNSPGEPVYEEGPPCSNCPLNSECCVDCPEESETYPGLCHLTSFPPVYPKKEDIFWQCAFEKDNPTCNFDVEGDGEWEHKETFGGNSLAVTLNEKQSLTAHFKQLIESPFLGTCMNIRLRKGPNVAGEKDDSKLEILMVKDGVVYPPQKVWTYSAPFYLQTPVEIMYKGNVKFSLKFTVPAGAPPQYLEIKKIEATLESCKYALKG